MVHASTQLSFVCVCGDLARAPHESAELELQYLNAVHLKSTRMCVLLRTYTSGVAPRGRRANVYNAGEAAWRVRVQACTHLG